MPSVDSLIRQAVALHREGELDKAQVLYRRVLDSDPRNADALRLLGLILFKQGDGGAALDMMRRAVSQRPGEPAFAFDLACVLEGTGRLDEAVAAYESVLRTSSSHAPAHLRLGNIHRRREQYDLARLSYEKAVALDPRLFDAWNNLGVACKITGDLTRASYALSQAVQLEPGRAECYNNLGMVFSELGEVDRAHAAFSRAVALDPRCTSAHTNLGTENLTRGDLAGAQTAFHRAREANPDDPVAHSNLLVSLAYDPSISPAELTDQHVAWSRDHAGNAGHRPSGMAGGISRGRLRIGYASPDFRSHPVASFMEPVLTNHDRSRFEVVCYSDSVTVDEVTTRLRSRADRWYDTSRLDQDRFCDQVRADGIDILVDLDGHLARNRLAAFAGRLAPIQITWLGYPYTTGLPAMDFRLTDPVINPVGEAFRGTEEPVRLTSFCCYQPLTQVPQVNPSPLRGNGFVTFGSLHNLVRLNDQVLALWAALMRRTPDSRLLVFRLCLTDWCEDRIRAVMGKHGVGPDRIIFRKRTDAERHYLSVYDEIDVSLDTFPWSGHTTACESLWMGVPMLTLYGDHYASRMVSSILTTVRLTECIARSPEEFLSRGEELVDAAPALRPVLRAQVASSLLCDGPAFTAELEKCLARIASTASV